MAMVGDRVGTPSANARRVDAPEWLKVHTGTQHPLGRRYHEWSAEQHAYLPDHCAVAEFDPRVAADAQPAITRPDWPLRRQLARLGLADEIYRAQADGDALDITALVDFTVERMVGTAGDARIYERRRRTAHDLGVLVLLDATGSTAQSTDGEQIFAAQRELAGRLTTVLEELGDRVALYGFHSMGREDVRFLRVKAFDDRFGVAARRRLAALAPSGFTRIGAAVRHGTHLLDTEAGTSKMLLVVVGDGLPYEQGYEERHAQEDTRRALSEAVARGVGCACISMRATTDARVVERVWGHVAHCHFADPDELAAHVRPLFRHALREAGASRRPTRSPTRSQALVGV
jgi:nitric oxide reductase activation protein